MKKSLGLGLLFACLLFTCLTASAMPASYRMSCGEAKKLVQDHGTILMSYANESGAGSLYDYIHSSPSACQTAWPVNAQTLGNSRCFIGYICGSRGSW